MSSLPLSSAKPEPSIPGIGPAAVAALLILAAPIAWSTRFTVPNPSLGFLRILATVLLIAPLLWVGGQMIARSVPRATAWAILAAVELILLGLDIPSFRFVFRPLREIVAMGPLVAAVSIAAATDAALTALRRQHLLDSVLGALIGLALVAHIFGAWKPLQFLGTGNLSNVLTNNYHFLIAAVGATFVIITAGIDLSVGSVMAFACVITALTLRGFTMPAREVGTTLAIGLTAALGVGACVASRLLQGGRKPRQALISAAIWGGGTGLVLAILWLIIAGRQIAPAAPIVAALAGVLAGALIGFINGSLITSLGLPSFVVTLAALQSVRGLTLYITGGTPISPDESWSPASRAALDSFRNLHYGDILGLPSAVWIALAVVAIGIPLLHFTIVGRYAYAIGSNERTARLCGVHVERYKTLCYVIAGATAGLAGALLCAKFGGGQPTEGAGAELTVIAAVVIGGTSLFGGEGTILGTLLGFLMLGLLYSGCVIADISTYVQQIFIGGTIVLAAALDRFRHLRK